MKKLNTQHLERCVATLQQSIIFLKQYAVDTLEYEVFRNATIKGYELSLETAAKLLKKKLKMYMASPRDVDMLTFKEVIRYAGLHGLLSVEEVSRWFQYRDNRNSTAHDYGVGFAEETLGLLPLFIDDMKVLIERLNHANT